MSPPIIALVVVAICTTAFLSLMGIAMSFSTNTKNLWIGENTKTEVLKRCVFLFLFRLGYIFSEPNSSAISKDIVTIYKIYTKLNLFGKILFMIDVESILTFSNYFGVEKREHPNILGFLFLPKFLLFVPYIVIMLLGSILTFLIQIQCQTSTISSLIYKKESPKSRNSLNDYYEDK